MCRIHFDDLATSLEFHSHELGGQYCSHVHVAETQVYWRLSAIVCFNIELAG